MSLHECAAQTTFDSPETAVRALLAAIQSDNLPLFLSIAGPGMSGFWSSGDDVRDAMEREVFVEESCKWEIRATPVGGRKVLYVGNLAQPFPAPLVNTGSGWRFHDEAGRAEIAARRILRNEGAILEAIGHFLGAEFMSAGTAGGQAFALKIRSTPGKHDGLFWSGQGEEDESPLGPRFAAAAYTERQPGEAPQPLFGYYLKMLPSQGGFALVAWPAKYGVGGVRSFMVSQLGVVYEKDLGSRSARVAESMPAFNPDSSWRRITHGE